VVDSTWALVGDGADEAELVYAGNGLASMRIRADNDRLRQLLENLLGNALEHSGEGITVTIGKLEDGFYIEDDGSGIPENDRPKIFDAGYSTVTEGTGFGLSIVKQIADSHGWDIRITEGTDSGARV